MATTLEAIYRAEHELYEAIATVSRMSAACIANGDRSRALELVRVNDSIRLAIEGLRAARDPMAYPEKAAI